MLNKQCPNCGKSFTVSNQNNKQECCTSKCKTELNNKRKTKQCEYCHKDFIAQSVSKNRFCSKDCSNKSMKVYNDFNCKNCGKQVKYKSNQSNIYCSKKCYSEYTQAQNKLKPIAKPIKLSSLVYFNECIQCNKLFSSQKQNSCYCSSKCRSNFGYHNNKPIYSKDCSECKSTFETTIKTKHTCNKQCEEIRILKYRAIQAKEYKKKSKANGTYAKDTHRKRAKRLNAKYENGITIKALIERDGNKCLICKKKVLKVNKSGYHKDNATIGHIIAMCNGGEHTMRNVQLECMECNTKKGVKNGGQQRLF